MAPRDRVRIDFDPDHAVTEGQQLRGELSVAAADIDDGRRAPIERVMNRPCREVAHRGRAATRGARAIHRRSHSRPRPRSATRPACSTIEPVELRHLLGARHGLHASVLAAIAPVDLYVRIRIGLLSHRGLEATAATRRRTRRQRRRRVRYSRTRTQPVQPSATLTSERHGASALPDRCTATRQRSRGTRHIFANLNHMREIVALCLPFSHDRKGIDPWDGPPLSGQSAGARTSHSCVFTRAQSVSPEPPF